MIFSRASALLALAATVISFAAGKATCVGKNIVQQETLMTSNGVPLSIKSWSCESIQVDGKNVTTPAASGTSQPARKRGIGQCRDLSATCFCGIADCGTIFATLDQCVPPVDAVNFSDCESLGAAITEMLAGTTFVIAPGAGSGASVGECEFGFINLSTSVTAEYCWDELSSNGEGLASVCFGSGEQGFCEGVTDIPNNAWAIEVVAP